MDIPPTYAQKEVEALEMLNNLSSAENTPPNIKDLIKKNANTSPTYVQKLIRKWEWDYRRYEIDKALQILDELD